MLIRSLAFIIATAALLTGAPSAYAAGPAVNYDDPNLAFTSEYVGDNAANCPKTLKGKALQTCLTKNGLVANEEISVGQPVQAASPPSSLH